MTEPGPSLVSTEPPRPAVVVGLGVTGLGVVRSLTHPSVPVRIPVTALESNFSAPSASTRLCRKEHCSDLGSRTLVDRLIELRPAFAARPVLFLSKDISVVVVAAAADELRRHYDFLLPTVATTNLLMEKTLFAPYATAHDFSIPVTRVITNETDALKAAAELPFPCVLKVTYRDASWQALGYPKGFLLKSSAALLDTWRTLEQSGSRTYVAQEWVDGGDEDLYFCLALFDEQSRCLVSFTGRKLRQWPLKLGNTCLAEPVECDSVERETLRLFTAVGFKGLGSVEFKRDRNDGRFKIMEPTVGRVNLQSEVSTANGVNLVWLQYANLTGYPAAPPRRADRPARWINEYADLKSCLVRIARREVSATDCLRSWRTPRYYALFRRDDPRPLVATFRQGVAAQLRRRLLPGRREQARDDLV